MKVIEKIHKWANRHEWILILIVAVLVMRVPSLFAPHYYGDEEIYFVMGRAWRENVPMYQLMFDHKPPFLYIIAGIAQSVFWFRAILAMTMVVHTYFFYRLAALIFSGKKWLLSLSTGIFVILTSLPLLEGNIANAELFMMVPITASLLIIWKAKNNDYSRIILAGLIGGIGWLFKVPVVMDVLAIGLYLYIYRTKNIRESIRAIFSPALWLYLFSFAIPLLSTFVYYYLKGHGQSYLDTVLTMNLGYVSSWSTSSYKFNPFRGGLFVRGLILASFSLILYVLRNKLPKRMVLPLLWLAFSFFGALLSGRPYPHYLLEPVVPLALVVPFIFVAANIWSWLLLGYLVIWGIFTNQQIKFWGYPTIPIYTNFTRYALGMIDKQTYYETFDGVKRNYKIGNYLKERMQSEDKLFVWGSDATIYNITDKLPAGGKYIVSFHVVDLKKHDYVMENLNANQPKYIVVQKEAPFFLRLDELLNEKYIRVFEYEGTRVYMRLPAGAI